MEENIKNIRIFKKLDENEFSKIIGKFKKYQFNAGQFIFNEGEKSDSLHIIESGRVEIFSINPENQQVIELIKLGPGTIIGEVGFITGNKRTSSVKCLVQTNTFSLTNHNFAELKKTDPSLVMKILKEIGIILSERLRWCDKFLVSSSDIRISRNFLDAIKSSSS